MGSMSGINLLSLCLLSPYQRCSLCLCILPTLIVLYWARADDDDCHLFFTKVNEASQDTGRDNYKWETNGKRLGNDYKLDLKKKCRGVYFPPL